MHVISSVGEGRARHRRIEGHRRRRSRRRSRARVRRSFRPAGPGRGRLRRTVRQVRADVRSPRTRPRAVDEAVRAFGGLDILINNAGVGLFANVADMSSSEWQQVIDTNLSGVFYCLSRGDPRAAQARRRLDHQHQQPGGQERLHRRRGLLRVQGRAEPVQRGADAGGPARRHPRELHHAGLGGDEFWQRDQVRKRAGR